jgi:magnesium chelatase accessory protein
VGAASYALVRLAVVARVRRFETLLPEDLARSGVTLHVRGRRVHVLIDGEGPPLLLLHGFGANAFAFRRIVPILSDEFSLIAPDLPGFGGSERDPHADHSYDALARLQLDLLDRLGIERVAVLGHSIGAAIALRMAARAPNRLTALVLAGGPGRPATVPGVVRPLATVLVPPIVESRRGIRLLTHLAMAPGAAPDPALVDAFQQQSRVKGHAATLVAMLTRTRHAPPPNPAEIKTPTLLLTGVRDGYMPPGRARALAAAMPRARAITVPGAAHLLFDEQPAICAAHIRAHVRDSRDT